MQAFQFYIQDDRYTVPSLLFVEARSPDRARVIAERHLRSSPHFSRIDVYLDDKRLFGISAARRSDDQSDAHAA